MNALSPEEPPSDLEQLRAAHEALKAEQNSLQHAYQELNARLEVLETQHTLSKRKPSFLRSPTQPQPTPARPAQPQQSSIPEQTLPWERLLGIQGFAWLGVLALLSAAGLFIRYAYVEGWLGPWAVLISGSLLAVGLLLSGNLIALRSSRYRSWAHALMGAGIALFYFLAYASYHFPYFQRVTHLNALADAVLLMLIVTGAIALSLYRKSQTLASRAFVLGFFTSFMSTSFSELTLFYNLFLSLGLLGVVFKARWMLLLRMGVVGSWVLHGIWVYNNPQLWWGTHSVLLIYVILYGVISLKARQHQPEFITGTLNIVGYLSVFGLLVQYDTPFLWGVHGLYSLISLGLLYRAQHQHQLHTVYHGLMGLSLPLGFYLALMDQSARVQGIFFMGLAVTLYGCARYLEGLEAVPLRLWQTYDSFSASCLMIGLYLLEKTPYTAMLFMAFSWFYLAHTRAFFRPTTDATNTHRHFWGIAWMAYLNSILVMSIRHYDHQSLLRDAILTGLLFIGFIWQRQQMSLRLKHLWLWPGSLALWMYTEEAFHQDHHTMIWTALGAVFVVLGFWRTESVVRYQGLAFLAVAGLKLLAVDLQGLSMGLRITSLFAVGVILMGLAWVYIRYEASTKEQP